MPLIETAQQPISPDLRSELIAPPFIADLDTYNGRAERIYGFRRIKKAIGDIAGVQTVDPLILLPGLYDEYQTHGATGELLESHAQFIWNHLQGDQYPLIVRRLFPDQNGDAQDGPRSGNINSFDDLRAEITKFYDFYNSHYSPETVAPEIMVHRLVDAGNPPKLSEPFLPFASGDVIPLDHDTYQIRGTFGADESVQGFPADEWIVVYQPDGSIIIRQTNLALKTASVVPAPGAYRQIVIPPEYQDVPALNHVQILSIAEVCRAMAKQFGPHRLEFDGTRRGGIESLVVIESAPFELRKNTRDVLKAFSSSSIQPMMLFRKDEDFTRIPPNSIVCAYIPKTHFQGNDRREALTRLSATARERNTQLVVFAAGNIATQHAVRVLMDQGHVVLFIENEEFEDGELMRIYPKLSDGIVEDLEWEREDIIAPQDRIEGRAVERIGGKAAGLQKLERYEFTVPPYLVLETSLFRRLIDELGARDRLALLDGEFDSHVIDGITHPIVQQILSYEGDLLPDFAEALRHIGGDRFAVRSSATCEDEQHSSFAGVFETILNVSPDDMNQVIKEVLASCLSPTAIQVAHVSGVKPSEMKMAVIIQRMVDAEKAGTVFTVDHIDRREDLIRVEGSFGLGEAIVEGTAQTHQAVLIDRHTGEIISIGGHYDMTRPVITMEEARMLVRLGLSIEDKFHEGPQDIEWAIDQQGQLYVLQARPLSVPK